MKVSSHVISSGLLGLVILALTNWQNAILFFIGGVLIDVDHYLFYILKIRDWSLIRAYCWHVEIGKKIRTEPKKYYIMLWLHTIEFLVVLLVISYLINNYSIFFGVCFHWLLDIIDMFRGKYVGVRDFSWIHFKLKRKRIQKERIIL